MGFDRDKLLREAVGVIRPADVDGLLVNDEKDVYYLTGYSCPGAKLLLTEKGKKVYFIDKMNFSLASGVLKVLRDVHIIPGQVMLNLKTVIREQKLKRIGINLKSLSAVEYINLFGDKSKLACHDMSSVIENMRDKKNGYEIGVIKKAAEETVKIWKKIKREIRTGMSEKDLAGLADIFVRGGGYENSFTTIAATGPNTAYPHAIATDRKLDKNEHLYIDFGVRYKGYCSDLTRTYYNGRINRQIRDFEKLVLKAQDMAIKRIKPGVAIGKVAVEVNTFFRKNGVGQYILHSLGHGVGLNVHEKPFLHELCGERFKKGMVVTVEPGLYKAGCGGVREEDMVLVTDKGCEVLTK
ncbi:MAG: Xaa-Pro peptidase family protein [Candidatus Omnitrophota bacterium]